MGFTRQIRLKLAFPRQCHASGKLFVAFLSLFSGLLISSSLQAGCGDYVILTGEIPAHLRTRFASQQETMGHQSSRDENDQSQFLDLYPPPAPPPCRGPSCGQNRSPAMATTPSIPADNQITLYCTNDSASSGKDRDGRHAFVSQPLLCSDHFRRIDRPPRA